MLGEWNGVWRYRASGHALRITNGFQINRAGLDAAMQTSVPRKTHQARRMASREPTKYMRAIQSKSTEQACLQRLEIQLLRKQLIARARDPDSAKLRVL